VFGVNVKPTLSNGEVGCAKEMPGVGQNQAINFFLIEDVDRLGLLEELQRFQPVKRPGKVLPWLFRAKEALTEARAVVPRSYLHGSYAWQSKLNTYLSVSSALWAMHLNAHHVVREIYAAQPALCSSASALGTGRVANK
jgi:hypothetical protein